MATKKVVAQVKCLTFIGQAGNLYDAVLSASNQCQLYLTEHANGEILEFIPTCATSQVRNEVMWGYVIMLVVREPIE
jgi:hypothetical protein